MKKSRLSKSPTVALLTAMILTITSLPGKAALSEDQELEVMAKAVLSDPEAVKVAFLSAHRFKHQKEVAAIRGITKSVADERMAAQSRRVEEYVDGGSFKNTLIQDGLREGLAILKDGVAVALKSPRFAMIPRTVTDKAADELLEGFARAPGKIDMKIESELVLLKYTLKSAKDRKDPNHEYSRQILQRLKINPEMPFEYDSRMGPDIRNARVVDEIKGLRADLKRLADKSNRTATDQQNLKIKSDRLLELATEDAQVGLKESKRVLTARKVSPEDIESAKKWSGRMNDVASGLGTAAQIALLLNDAKTADRLNRAAEVCSKLGDVIATTMTKSLTENPAVYTNVYVAAAVVIMNFINASKEQDAMSAMMKQMQEISRQIEELRQEMHGRFDKLDLKMDQYFDRSFVELVSVNAGVARIEKLAQQVLQDMSRFQFQTMTGLKYIWQTNMNDWKTQCFPDGGKMDSELVRRCRNQFAFLSVGQWDTRLGQAPVGSDSVSRLSALSHQEYRDLVSFLANQNSDLPEAHVHPANWMEGARLFVKLFKSQPQHRQLAVQPGPGFTESDGLGLDNVIRQGEQIKIALQNLVLRPTGQKYELRKEIMTSIVDRYQKESEDAITKGFQILKQKSGLGPNPRVGLSQAIVVDENYAFLKNPLWFCPGTPAKIDIGNFSHFMYNSKPAIQSSPSGNQKVDTSHLEKTFKHDFLQVLNPQWFRWNSSFLPLLPPSLVWASRMGTDHIPGFEKIEVSACLTQVSVPNFINTPQKLKIDFHFEVEFRVAFGEGQNRRVARAGKIVLDDSKEHPNYVMTLGKVDRVSLVANFWAGQICPGYAPCSFAWRPGVVENGAARFKVVPGASIDPEFTKFEQALQRQWSVNAEDIKTMVDANYANSNHTSTRDLLFQLANLGLDSRAGGVTNFLEFVNFEDTLPTSRIWAQVAASGALSPDSLVGKLKQRVDVVRQRIEQLSTETELRPRGAGLDSLLGELKSLRGR